MTSLRVLRRSSRASSAREIVGRGRPASPASRSTASGKLSPSVIITKSKMLPFLPEEKSNHAIFWSLTKNEGVFSWLNGERPLHSRPAFLRRTRRPTTSETRRRARSSSRNWGGKRMRPGRDDSVACQYRTAPRASQNARVCPGYPQAPRHRGQRQTAHVAAHRIRQRVGMRSGERSDLGRPLCPPQTWAREKRSGQCRAGSGITAELGTEPRADAKMRQQK